MAGYPTIHEYLGFAPSRWDGAIAPTGGNVLLFSAAATLNSGDVVYCPATTPTAVNKSTTASLYSNIAGVVVGGQATGKRTTTNADGKLQETGILAATVGQFVWVQQTGIARVVAGGTIAAGARVMVDTGTAGRVITYTSPNFVIGIALDAATVGTKLRILFTNSASSVFAPTTDSIVLGASPPAAPGAIRVDASSYTNVVLNTINGTSALQVINSTTGSSIGTQSAHPFYLNANSINKWLIPAQAAGTASFQANEVVARIVGGSSNGLSIRNSGDTRDNFLIADNGTLATLDDGTNSGIVATATASGDFLAGVIFTSGRNNGSAYLRSIFSGTAGIAGIGYFDGTNNRIAVEVQNVAAGSGALKLMRTGGNIQIGGNAGAASGIVRLAPKDVTGIADATGTAVLTATIPNARSSAMIRIKVIGALGAGGAIGAGEAVGTVTYDVAIARIAGVATTAVASSAFGSAMTNVAGAATITVTAAVSAIAGGAGASNTFTINVTITKGSGASANHTCLVIAEVVNYATGTVTIA